MEHLLDQFMTVVLNQPSYLIYAVLFISAVTELLFPPVPGDTMTILGSFLVGTGKLSFIPVLIFTTAGSVFGFFILYGLGYFLGREFFIKHDFKFFPAEKLIKGESWLKKWGLWIVAANRFVPGIRAIVPLIAGIAELNFLKVLYCALGSALAWNIIWITVGFMLGSKWEIVRVKMKSIMGTYNTVILFVLIGFVVILLIRKFIKSRKQKVS